MGKSFLSLNTNFNDFVSIPSVGVDSFLLENNARILNKLYGFLQKNESLLFVTGFQGTGKTQLVNHLLNYIDKDVELYRFRCSNSTTIDDVLISLWSQFAANASAITFKYNYSMSFQDKVSAFLLNSDSNIILTIYDYDLLLESNSKDIFNFITSISENRKIKIIITSKTFDTNIVSESLAYTKVILKAFSRIVFEKYLNNFGIKSTSRMFDELYKITRGYFLYTQTTAQILTLKVLSISNYLVAYTNSGMTFDAFLAKAYISMLSELEQEVLRYFCVARHRINKKVLEYFGIYDDLAINTLIERGFIKEFDDGYFLTEYYRDSMLNDSDSDSLSRAREVLVKFYNEQLGLKPSERLVLLSRNTMRSEIEYQNSFSEDDVESEPKPEPTLGNTSSEELLSRAETLFSEYNYNDALKIYLMLLDSDNIDKVNLYKKIFRIYECTGNFKYSLYYLNILIKHFADTNNKTELYEYKLAMSRVLYQSYKTNDAIVLLNEVIDESEDVALTIDAYTLLANVYISLANKDKAYEFYNKAIELSEKENTNNNLSELYFKFAIIADERGELATAVQNYKKCVSVASDDDKYKSLSYSNLGEYYLDVDNKALALESFEAAYRLDSANNNDYGIYYSASNIAKLCRDDSEKLYKYLLKAREAALRSKDIFAIANAGLHLGDYLSNNNLPEAALNEYFSVLNLVKDKFSKENKNKIMVRINDIKHKLGDERFNELFGNDGF